MRAGDKLVDVTVVNLFAETSEENETTISNKINKAVASNPNTFSDYTSKYEIILFKVYLNIHLPFCKLFHYM